MIIILTPTDLKDSSTSKASYPKNLTLDDFFVGLKGWPYLVAFVHRERAHILKQGNWTGNEATSINKLWQLISRHLEWCREEKLPTIGHQQSQSVIDRFRHRQGRRFGLKLPSELKALEEE